MSAELNVELRLLLNQVGNDALKAADIVKKTLGMSLGGSGGTDPLSKFREGASKSKDIIAQLNSQIKRLHTEMDAFRKRGINLEPEFAGKMREASKEMKAL